VEAERQLNTSLDYWFRTKYNLSPKDPNFLNCEPWEIELELELDTAWQKKIESHQNLQKTQEKPKCSECGTELFGNVCLNCGHEAGHITEHYFDPDFEEYAKQIEEENEEADIKDIKWEPVPDDEPIL
jgi:hypothetical protein